MVPDGTTYVVEVNTGTFIDFRTPVGSVQLNYASTATVTTGGGVTVTGAPLRHGIISDS